MRLQRVQVQNFRSIVDSNVVDIEDVVTVVIGKNEQGKTNFLKGLASFNKQHTYSPSDLPNHLRPSLEAQKPRDIPIVTVWLAPEPSEQEKLQEVLDQVASTYKVVKYFDGHYAEYAVGSAGHEKELEFPPPDTGSVVSKIGNEVKGLKERLTEHSTRADSFAPAIAQLEEHSKNFTDSDFTKIEHLENNFKTFSTALKGLPGQDKPIQEEMFKALKTLHGLQAELHKLLTSDPFRVFNECLPSFVFHSTTLAGIPDEVNVAPFVSDPEGTSEGMANLCRVAGLTTQMVQKLAAADTAQRQTYEDHYKTSVSGGINEFWTQAKYHVHFRIEKQKLSVSISDDIYSPRIPPTERSDGFQWYLSFFCTMLDEDSATRNSVLLLDNPGLELHADGQNDIKRFLEERLSQRTQVIYVTHSPAMIDPFNLEQIRSVRLISEVEGSKLSNNLFKEGEDADLLEPVRSAIGASLVHSLMFADFNVLVEGAADKPILEGAFSIEGTNYGRKVLVNGSVAESKDGFLPRFYQRARLPFVVFLDADSGGRNLVKLLKKWEIPDENIVKLKDLNSEQPGDFELEDILSSQFYHTAVCETYPDKKVERPDVEKGKRTKAYEKAYKDKYNLGFNKKRVGVTIKRLLLSRRELDEETLQNLKKITDALYKACEEQTSKA